MTLYRSELRGADKEVVEDGSAVMSPMNRKNTDVTDSGGHFGWDVIAGYYKVRVEADGCYAPGSPSTPFVDTDEMEIPPPVTDLDIRLECPKPAAKKASLTLPKKAGKVKVDKKGKFKVKGATAGCPAEAAAACTATLTVTAKAPKHAKPLKLGSSELTLAAGSTAKLKGKLSRKGTKRVKRAKKLEKATIAVGVDAPGGESTSGSLKTTLVAR